MAELFKVGGNSPIGTEPSNTSQTDIAVTSFGGESPQRLYNNKGDLCRSPHAPLIHDDDEYRPFDDDGKMCSSSLYVMSPKDAAAEKQKRITVKVLGVMLIIGVTAAYVLVALQYFEMFGCKGIEGLITFLFRLWLLFIHFILFFTLISPLTA